MNPPARTKGNRPSTAAGVTAERHRRYAELRTGGLDSWDAAREVGISLFTTRTAYERWFAAGQSGLITAGGSA